MKIKILQTTTTILTEDRQVESTYTNETLRTQFDMSSQKMSALLAQLVEEGHLVAEDIKRKKHYSFPSLA